MKHILHDPFGRHTVVRRTVYISEEVKCAWCDEQRWTSTGRLYLYQYGLHPDGGTLEWQDHLFCSIGCVRNHLDKSH